MGKIKLYRSKQVRAHKIIKNQYPELMDKVRDARRFYNLPKGQRYVAKYPENLSLQERWEQEHKAEIESGRYG